MSYSKPVYGTLNYASTANTQEVMKFYNPGGQRFETDFEYRVHLNGKNKRHNWSSCVTLEESAETVRKIMVGKGPVKLIQQVKMANSFLYAMCKQFHAIIFSLSE